MEFNVFSPSKTFSVSAKDQKEAVEKAAVHFIPGSEFIVGNFHYHKYEGPNRDVIIIRK